jgi:hypothetical protein
MIATTADYAEVATYVTLEQEGAFRYESRGDCRIPISGIN